MSPICLLGQSLLVCGEGVNKLWDMCREGTVLGEKDPPS